MKITLKKNLGKMRVNENNCRGADGDPTGGVQTLIQGENMEMFLMLISCHYFMNDDKPL